MIDSIEGLQKWLISKTSPEYSRTNYDRFLSSFPVTFSRPFIHITGSNGKGSTANFLASIYQRQGYKTGLYCSPYFHDFTEMIMIDGKTVPHAFVLSFFSKWVDKFEQFNLTAFEMQTLCMFAYFESEECDLAIIEVGMGGKIDATNVFHPMVSVITSVSLEHTEYLGSTIASITNHKAAIIKESSIVVTSQLDEEANLVIKEKIQETKSPWIVAEKPIIYEANPLSFKVKNMIFSCPNFPLYQAKNASITLSVIESISDKFPVEEVNLKLGIESMKIFGRFQRIQEHPTIIVDGGHNPEAIDILIESMAIYKNWDIHILYASFKDKASEEILVSLQKLSSQITLTTFQHPRAKLLKDYGEKVYYPFVENYQGWIKHWKNTYSNKCVLLITGSLAFSGQVLKMLKE
jgi:dihydrofolate synthase/folylpolyglutamate synthase